MLDPLLDIHLWDNIDNDTRLERVLHLAHQLLSPWQFIGITHHALGDQEHACAYFQWHKRRFVLIPGAHAMLGYDRARALRPHQFYDRRAGYIGAGEYIEEPDFPDLDVYLAHYDVSHAKARLTPLREAIIAPFLLEQQANPYRKSDPVPHHIIAEEVAREGFRLASWLSLAPAYREEWDHPLIFGGHIRRALSVPQG